MKATYALILLASICSIPVWADESLQLITTIPVTRPNTRITSITPIGDFNADGYPDLAVGVGTGDYTPYYEAVYLYYGGPSFDSIPDLTFFSDRQNEDLCPSSIYATAFGQAVTGLGDFNGDGFDDFAVSAFALCTYTYHVGRIYIYFGGPNPDTIPDLEITITKAESIYTLGVPIQIPYLIW